MLSNSVVSGGFALLLLYLTAMHAGTQVPMLLCVLCAAASWIVNIAEETENALLRTFAMLMALAAGGVAFYGVASKVLN